MIPNAGVRFPPPALYAAGLALGWAIDRFAYPLPITERIRVLETLGIVLSLVAAEYNLWKSGGRPTESHSVYRRR